MKDKLTKGRLKDGAVYAGVTLGAEATCVVRELVTANARARRRGHQAGLNLFVLAGQAYLLQNTPYHNIVNTHLQRQKYNENKITRQKPFLPQDRRKVKSQIFDEIKRIEP